MWLWIVLIALACLLALLGGLAAFYLLRPKVFILLPGGTTQKHYIAMRQSVLALKKSLEKTTGLPPQDQALAYSGIILTSKHKQKAVDSGSCIQQALEPDDAILGRDFGIKNCALIQLHEISKSEMIKMPGKKAWLMQTNSSLKRVRKQSRQGTTITPQSLENSKEP